MGIMAPLRQATAIRNQCAVWRIGGGGLGGGAQVVKPALVQQLLLRPQARRNCAVRCGHSDANTADNDVASFQLGSVGVAAALAAEGAGVQQVVQPTIWDEFALRDRVALVLGANRGLGLWC